MQRRYERLGEVLQRWSMNPRAWAPLSGGDINDAYRVELDDGRRVFVKSNASPPAGLFGAEAEGLRWLAEAGGVRVPRVLAVQDDEPALLVLEYLEPAPRRRDFNASLGAGLAALHASGAASWGWQRDNFIGTLPQPNQPSASWSEFYGRRRLEPQLRRSVDRGLVGGRTRARLESLVARLPELLPDLDSPHRVHGDLWAGNLHVDERGAPALLDPAPYGGHGEVDLAMMTLFGGFDAQVFASYREHLPIESGVEQRAAVYQLYPLLVHVNLFGASYLSGVEQRLQALGF